MLEVDGVSLAVHDSAPGTALPTVVCLHAIAHGGSDFASLEQALAGRYRVITLDWPGQGRSGPDTEPASAARYAHLFERVIARLGLERFVLVGNSIGGAAAITFAAAHPEQVRALVLANPGGLDPGGWLSGLFIGHLVRHFEAGARDEAAFADWFRGYYADVLVTPAAHAQLERILAAGYEAAPVLTQAWRSFARPEANLRALLPKLTMPVWVAWADRDGLIQWGRNHDALELIPHATVGHFEAGHAPFLEMPTEFNAGFEAFLRSVP